MKFNQKSGRIYRFVLISTICSVVPFQLFVFHLNWTNSIHDWLMLVYYPLYLIYMCFSNVFMLYFFIVTARYLRIKQQFKFRKLKSLSAKLIQRINNFSNKNPTKFKSRTFLQKYARLNREIISLFQEIRAQNRFWSRYLTIYALAYIVEICELTYVFVFYAERIKYLYAFLNVQFISILVLLTAECSLILYRNAQIHQLKRRFVLVHLLFDQQQQSLSIHNLLKFNSTEANQKAFCKTGFTLINNWQINSRMLELVN